jgi:mRNA interferase RelE/StbE
VSAWRLVVAPPARRQLDRLPDKIHFAVLDTLTAIRENPHRLGGPLRFELSGYRSARRGTYRVVYRIDEETRTIHVVAIAHRAHAYRPDVSDR